jgi:hypothetical protein
MCVRNYRQGCIEAYLLMECHYSQGTPEATKCSDGVDVVCRAKYPTSWKRVYELS